MSGENTYSQNHGSQYTSPDHILKQTKLTQNHEKTILTETNKHEIEILDKKNKQSILIKDKELGWFGLFFGGKELTSLNISGMLIIFLILTGLILSITIYKEPKDLESVLKIWGIITPIITLTLGYLFGNKDNSNVG